MRGLVMVVMIEMVALGAGGCGGKSHPAAQPSDDGDMTASHEQNVNDEADMVPMDQIDEITRRLDRRRDSVSRCLAIAVDAKELPKTAHGKITVALTVKPSGHADAVKVISSTLESKSLADCVVGRISEIEFPHVPKDFETSYTYGFEAN